jgi:hypothetical protein
MAGVRRALIVATDEYSDPKLTELNAPATDALALAEVLQNVNVGAFEVETVLNQECQDVRVALARFLKGGKRDDTLLLHFSCHGVKDIGGELYFATTDTDLTLLEDTGVSSARVKAAIEASRAGLILCLVDCCYAGAFAKGVKAADTIDLTERLGGHGRAVITASNSMQLALDGEETPSLFTRAVVEGLSTGDADLDLDGLVSLDEFYSFVHDRVTAENPLQTPVKSFEVQGDVYVARRGTPVTTPAPLPQKLLDTVKFGEDYERRGAVTKLAEYLVKGHPGRAVAARQALEKLRDTDVNLLVRQDAAEALDSDGSRADEIPDIPPYDPGPEPPGDGPSETLRDQKQPPSPDRWKIILAGAGVAAVALLVVAYLVFGRSEDDPDDDDKPDPPDLVALPENHLMMGLDVDGQHQLVTVNVDTGETEVVSTDADVFLPTISHDRRQMVYLLGERASTRTPTLAGVDGSEPTPLVSEESDRCQYTRRPTQSPDGSQWAMVCYDVAGGTDGLFVVGEDGVPTELTVPYNVTGAPAWTDDGEIVFVTEERGDRELLWEVPADGTGAASLLEGVDAVSAGDPDWSPEGLLYLGIDEAGKRNVYVYDADGEDRALTAAGDIEAASWSEDGQRVAFTSPDGSGTMRLWTKDVARDGPRVPVAIEGEPGPPAWSSR